MLRELASHKGQILYDSTYTGVPRGSSSQEVECRMVVARGRSGGEQQGAV